MYCTCLVLVIDSSSVSEKKPVVVMKQPSSVTSVLRKNPNIKRELRPALEQALLEKLESLGVKPVCNCTFMSTNTRWNL